ncbi:MAG: NAD(P)H-dependent oxidoreductase subunit E [Nitrospirae bacterium]|nr:NAD(P)H-dependent oxidoreductase subunit E [Nitrospirota bacterium]
MEALERIYANHKDEGNIIAILQALQEAFGYIPEEAVNWLADRLWIPRSNFFGIATFYAQFYLSPRGKNIITACSGTACHVKGSERLINTIGRELNLLEGKNITEDNMFTLEKVNCVGACSIAPVVIINKKVHGKASADKIIKEIKGLQKK